MRWAQQQRIAFIGERLLAGESVNRSDIMEKFGVSTPQASSDIRAFNVTHPGAMKYDPSRKTFVGDCITPRAGRNTTEAARNLIYADDTWLLEIARRDPGMIRDVAAALIQLRDPPPSSSTKGDSALSPHTEK